MKRTTPALPSATGLLTILFIFLLHAGAFAAPVPGPEDPAPVLPLQTQGAWLPVGTGVNYNCKELVKDGLGNIYAGGDFTLAGGQPVSRGLAKWNGSTWSGLGTVPVGVNLLTVDAANKLYAAGVNNFVFKWNGIAWDTVGTSNSGQKLSIAIGPDGKVYVCRYNVNNYLVQCWNGTSWATIGTFNDRVNTFEFLGTDVYVGGGFTTVNGDTINHVARWNGANWVGLGTGTDGVSIDDLIKDANGNLYASGVFGTAGGVPARRIAKWNGSAWSALGFGIKYGDVMDFDGNGNLVVVGGYYSGPDGNYDYHSAGISRWDGNAWVGEGYYPLLVNATGGYAMVAKGAHDVYVGGLFNSTFGSGIAKWDNSVFDWYRDSDNDDYGDYYQRVYAVTKPSGYVSPDAGFDCNDAVARIHPNAIEICNEVDDDCDGMVNEGFDTDGDEVPDCTDCAPDDPNYPKTFYVDMDGDGFGANYPFFVGCVPPDTLNNIPIPHWVLNNDDCNDDNPTAYPGATEICGNGIDEDCDTQDGERTYYSDFDGDGYGIDEPLGYSYYGCDPPAEINGVPIPHWALELYDCDETNPAIHPNAVDTCGNGIDEDCDGVDLDAIYYVSDFDGDGYGYYFDDGVNPPTGYFYEGCTPPDTINGVPIPHWATNNDDCDDNNADPNGHYATYYTDFDQDGYGYFSDGFSPYPYYGCPPPPDTINGVPIPAWSLSNDDCNDANATVYPGAPELCDGLDNDCDVHTPDPCGDPDGDNFPDYLDCAPSDPNLPNVFYSDFDADGYGYFYWDTFGIRHGFQYFGCFPPAVLNGVPVPAWSTENGDCFDMAPTFNPGSPYGEFFNMLPADGATNLPKLLNFSWSPVPGATSYDLFLWKDGNPEPSVPTLAGKTGINLAYNGNGYFLSGVTYHWRLAARSPECYQKGQEQAFSIITPPDLVVDTVIAPLNGFSGQPLTLSWVINNAGLTTTGMTHWNDYIYLSADNILNQNVDVNLGNRVNFSALTPGQSYSNTATFNLPQGISGEYYLFIVTDRNASLTETNEQNNTGVSAPFPITLSPPPDLLVTSIVTPANVFSGSSMTFSWTVTNTGTGQTVSAGWTDRAYISADSVLNINNAIVLGIKIIKDTLEVDSSYTQTMTANLPQGVLGPHYVYIVTDVYNQEFEQANEGNNTGQSPVFTVLLTPPPDLQVTTVSAPAIASNHQIVSLSWTVQNAGASTASGTWADRVYFSTNPAVTNFASLSYLGTFTRPNNLNPGESYSKTINIAVPGNITGNAYFYVYTDAEDRIYEYTFNSNNVTRAPDATDVRSPDLRPIDISANASAANAGGSVLITYTVKNEGNGNLQDIGWRDIILLNPGQSLLHTELVNQAVPSNGTYTRTVAANIPLNIPTGTYAFTVKTDAQGSVYEAGQDGDNILDGPLIDITGYPLVDLSVLPGIVAPDSVDSGQKIAVSWEVRNLGSVSTLATAWLDALYLSTDNVWSANDIVLGLRSRGTALGAGASYPASLGNIAIPNGLSGDYYLLVKTDRNFVNIDADYGNNVRAKAIHIRLTPPPDLVIPNFTAPASGFSGQPLQLVWNVSNFGSGPTLEGNWVDKVYLSDDKVVDDQDIPLITVPHTGNLPLKTSYTVTQQVTMPMSQTGNRYLIVRTDDNNSVFEHTLENNNTAWQAITLTLPPPADLVVTEVFAPLNATTGAPVTVNWTLANTGANPATGMMKEAVFFSKDTNWDVDDPLLGVLDANINLPPGATLSHSLTANLKGVEVGDYYAIVRTDLQNNIHEVNDTNNLTRSVTLLHVDVPELYLNTLTPNTLYDNTELYYRIEADTLGGETLLVTLKGDSIAAANELYLRDGQTPSRVVYDYAFGEPNYGNQEVIVPALNPDTYYLMAYGNTTNGDAQAVTLKAEILEFEIRRARAEQGGNTGRVTLEIKGSKFDSTMTLTLSSVVDTILADTVIYIDPTKVYATFDLSGKTIGMYDVTATKSNAEAATLNNGFQVIPGSAPDLALSVVHPSVAARGQIVALQIQFANNGTTDLVNAKVDLRSLAEAPVALSPADLNAGQTALELVVEEFGGPPGILRPGAIGSVTVYARAIKQLAFTLTEMNP